MVLGWALSWQYYDHNPPICQVLMGIILESYSPGLMGLGRGLGLLGRL